MSLFAVKNDKGEWLSFDSSHESVWDTNNPTFFKDKIYAEAQSIGRRAHVVKLVDAPAKIVVSEAEAEMLEQATCDDDPAELIVGFVNSHDKYDDDSKAEDRLMRAYVNGWTIEKPKRYVLPMPDGTSDELYQGKYLAILDTGGFWHGSEHRHDITKQAELEYFLVTQADIDAAPAWVKAIKPVEVTDDGIR